MLWGGFVSAKCMAGKVFAMSMPSRSGLCGKRGRSGCNGNAARAGSGKLQPGIGRFRHYQHARGLRGALGAGEADDVGFGAVKRIGKVVN